LFVTFSRYKTEYGFTLNRKILCDDIRVRGVGKTDHLKNILAVNERKSGSLNPVDVIRKKF
jgi:hypothetical protein